MRAFVPRPLAVIVVGVVPAILLAGCGEDSTGARTTLAEIQPSSYVVREPATTTTTLAEGEVAVDEEGRSPVEQTYVLQSGDYPAGVAERYGISVEELNNYNSETEGYGAFFVGLEIKIPPNALVPTATPETPTTDAPDTDADTDTDTGTTAPAGTTTTIAPAGECTPGSYTITAEDTSRTRVAEQFDITVEQLDAANANTEGYAAFYPGLEIVIPCSADE